MLQAIIDHTRAFIYVKDLNGRYLMVNQRFLELTRTNAEAVVGKTDHDLFSVQEADRFRAMDRRVLAAGTAMTEQESVERDGRLGVYISVKCALRGKTGELQGILGISTDITDLTRKSEGALLGAARPWRNDQNLTEIVPYTERGAPG